MVPGHFVTMLVFLGFVDGVKWWLLTLSGLESVLQALSRSKLFKVMESHVDFWHELITYQPIETKVIMILNVPHAAVFMFYVFLHFTGRLSRSDSTAGAAFHAGIRLSHIHPNTSGCVFAVSCVYVMAASGPSERSRQPVPWLLSVGLVSGEDAVLPAGSEWGV